MSLPNPEPALPIEFWDRLKNAETVPFQGLGNSMRPFFPSGTWFLLRQDPLQQIRIGDLVLMEKNGQTVLHRILQISDKIITQGDSYSQKDTPWEPVNYRARVIGAMQEKPTSNIDLTNRHRALCFSYRFSGSIIRFVIQAVRRIRSR